MSGNLREKVELALLELRRITEAHAQIIRKSETTEPPTPIELSAAAYMLQSIYTWVENIFKRVAQDIDGNVPETHAWHRDLLLAMSRATENRPAVISHDLLEVLRDYMGFRHFSRNASTLFLDWDEMVPLVRRANSMIEKLSEELSRFLSKVEEDWNQ